MYLNAALLAAMRKVLDSYQYDYQYALVARSSILVLCINLLFSLRHHIFIHHRLS